MGIKYKSIGKAVVRLPAMDYSKLRNMLYDSAKFKQFIRTEKFQEALFYASPELYYETEKYLGGKLSDKDSQRILNSLTKYAERMATRCTPFASFAGCGVVNIDDGCDLVSNGDFKSHFRYDMQFICLIAGKLLKYDRNIYRGMSYVKNPTLFKVGTDFRYTSQNYSNGLNDMEIKATGIMGFVIKKASKKISFQELEASLIDEYGLEYETTLDYIFRLSISGVLLNDLTPDVIGYDYFNRLLSISEYSSTDSVRSYFKSLTEILSRLNNGSDLNFGSKLLEIEKIYALNQEMGIKADKKSVLQIDTTFSGDKMIFQKEITTMIENSIRVYSKIMPAYGNERLRNFMSRFESRYEGSRVKLVEALNPEVGVGYEGAKSIRMPLLDELKPPTKKTNGSIQMVLTPFQQLLLNKLVSADSCCREIIITDEDISELPDNGINDLPLSMAAMFKIVGADHGQLLIGALHYCGNSAVNMLARFCDGDDQILDLCQKIALIEQNESKNIILCEISHLSQPRTGNVLLRPNLRLHQINYLTAPSDSKGEILLSDFSR